MPLEVTLVHSSFGVPVGGEAMLQSSMSCDTYHVGQERRVRMVAVFDHRPIRSVILPNGELVPVLCYQLVQNDVELVARTMDPTMCPESGASLSVGQRLSTGSAWPPGGTVGLRLPLRLGLRSLPSHAHSPCPPHQYTTDWVGGNVWVCRRSPSRSRQIRL